MKHLAQALKQVAAISGIALLISCGDKKTTATCCCTWPFKANEGQYTYYAFTELDSAAVCAQKRNLNILVIFSGYCCMALPGMEWDVLDRFGNPEFIQKNYVIAWLPVDDKKQLKDTTQTEIIQGKTYRITTEGKRNAVLQIKLFNTNGQPVYGILNPALKPVCPPLFYTKDEEEVEAFIKSGIVKK
ncbi:MAG: hypothetical protein IM638_13910 [Bacteroidetes bacterium]|nr:hypothetical protein [Bacteroidota bacterium]